MMGARNMCKKIILPITSIKLPDIHEVMINKFQLNITVMGIKLKIADNTELFFSMMGNFTKASSHCPTAERLQRNCCLAYCEKCVGTVVQHIESQLTYVS